MTKQLNVEYVKDGTTHAVWTLQIMDTKFYVHTRLAQSTGIVLCVIKKSVELLSLVFGLRDRLQATKNEMDSMKKEINEKITKIELGYEAVKEDIKTLRQKMDEGIKHCFTDSDKMVKSLQHQTRVEINEEIKTTS